MLQWVECVLQIQEIEFEGGMFLPLSLSEKGKSTLKYLDFLELWGHVH